MKLCVHAVSVRAENDASEVSPPKEEYNAFIKNIKNNEVHESTGSQILCIIDGMDRSCRPCAVTAGIKAHLIIVKIGVFKHIIISRPSAYYAQGQL